MSVDLRREPDQWDPDGLVEAAELLAREVDDAEEILIEQRNALLSVGADAELIDAVHEGISRVRKYQPGSEGRENQ